MFIYSTQIILSAIFKASQTPIIQNYKQRNKKNSVYNALTLTSFSEHCDVKR